MVAPATAAASDIRARAHAHLDSTLAFLASAKNTPAHSSDLAAIVDALIARADEAMLHQIVQPRGGPARDALLWGVIDSLDWIAARNIVRLFAHVARLELGAPELQTLITGLQLTVKNRQTRQGLALRWPDGPALEQAAIRHAGASAPHNAAELETALIDGFRTLELAWFEPALAEGA